MKTIETMLAEIPKMKKIAKEREKKSQEKELVNPQKGAQKQLPLWPDVVRAVPNGILRSALFGVVMKGNRRYVNGEEIAALQGVTIRYKGERLDQCDLDVWESVLHVARLQAMGNVCKVTSYSLLKMLGRSNAGKNRLDLHEQLERLCANAISIKQERYSYIGSLVEAAIKDEVTKEYLIRLNPEMMTLFSPDQFTLVDWQVRRELKGQQLAQWLHGFFSSHAKPYPMKISTLLTLAGSENGSPKSAKQKLKKALESLKLAGIIHGEKFDFEIKNDLLVFSKKTKGSQRKHLAKTQGKKI